MHEPMPLTMEELHNRRRQSLEKAGRAIAGHPDEYREIKRIIESVLARTVDISEYYRIARRLAGLLESLNAAGPDSVFAYYYVHIDPEQKGDARYFKIMCADLREQIREVDRYRRSKLRPVQ